MSINYDPDGKPNLSPGDIADAMEFGLHPVLVLCDERGAKPGDAKGVSFYAFVHFVPRKGDRIQLEDGRMCEVERAYYKTSTRLADGGKANWIHLVPNVVAYLVG